MALVLSCLAVVATWVVYLLYTTLDTRIRRRKMRYRSGCQPLPEFPARESLAKDFERSMNESIRDGRVTGMILEQYRKVKALTFQVITRGGCQICTADPVNLQFIASRINEFSRAQYGSKSFFGDRKTILYQTGASWKRSRDLVMPLFKRAESKDMEHFAKFVDRFIHLLPRNQEFDIQPLMRKLLVDSSTEFIFGESLDSLRDTTGSSSEFIAAYNCAMIGTGRLERPEELTVAERLGFHDRAWLADCKTVHDYVDARIARHRRHVHEKIGDGDGPENPPRQLSRYVLIDGMSPLIPDPTELRFQLLGIFTMAHETAAMTFSNALFLLARHPQVWAHLRASAPPRSHSSGGGDAPPLTHDRLQRDEALAPFRWTVYETVRLHSPIVLMTRTAQRDMVLPRGGGCPAGAKAEAGGNGGHGAAPALVPRGTLLRCDWFPRLRDREVWGQDVEAFRPERWEGRKVTPDLLPFSSGPRMCPASAQVVVQCAYMLVRLAWEFESIENRDPCEGFVEGVLICLESRNGCRIALHP